MIQLRIQILLSYIFREEYMESLIYFIPSEYRKLHEIFEAVVMAKEFLSIEDFGVKEATLEQIFMLFN